jgi:predicted nucleotidyltransferase
MTTMEQFQIEAERLEGFCRKRGISKVALFGSVLGDDFGPESDADILIDLVPEARLGLLDMIRMELELSVLLG